MKRIVLAAVALALGAAAPAAHAARLHRVLVTGDSLASPLDREVARGLAGRGVKVTRDARPGTGISKNVLGDWTKVAARQQRRRDPDAVVLFTGANEGWPMRGLACCDERWSARYARKVGRVMDAYRGARVYWVTVPTPEDPDRQLIERTVNAAVASAAAKRPGRVTLVDTIPIFTPGDVYRAAMPVGGRDTVVRRADGIHLNRAGARVLAQTVRQDLTSDFTRRRR
jgi:hypothetical protein